MDISSSALFSYLSDDLRADYGELDFGPASDYWPGASLQDVYRLRMVRSFYKKFVEETAADADDKCLEKFLASNRRCANWALNLSSSKDELLYGEFRRVMDDFFYPSGEPLLTSYFDILNRGRAGPGASLGAAGEDFYSKFFSSRLTETSPELYQMYNEYCSWYPYWRDGEITRLTSLGTPVRVPGNRLSFVRKTRDISRSICTEPSLNMFYQLGFGAILTDRLQSAFGINLSDQPNMNRYLACRGSSDDSIATIDLESASDSLSLNLALTVFPDYVNDILCKIRSAYTEVRGEQVKLDMVSSMGNGFTFPLQTAVFASVVVAVMRAHGYPPMRSGTLNSSWGVFGDDIACPSHVAGDVCRLLSLLGFRVNNDKSYLMGPFRESCGHDYFEGRNVRGVYIKSLSSPQDRYVAINLLNEWSARTGIPLPRTVGYLVDSVRFLAIPPFEGLDAGIRVPVAPPGLWSKSKQRYIYRCCTPVQTLLTVSTDPRVPPSPPPKKRVRKLIANPDGLVWAFLGGYINNMRIARPLKQGASVSYRTVTKVAPFWGPTRQQLEKAPSCDFWRRWNTSTLQNICSEESQD